MRGARAQLEFPERAIVSREAVKTVHFPPASDWAWSKDSLNDSGIHQAVAHFLECVRTRTAPLTSREDALFAQELVDRLYGVCHLPPMA